MTAYHGGKQRIGKAIAQKIYDTTLDLEEDGKIIFKGYCEPFCGMCWGLSAYTRTFQGS